jgi:mono/diheme cytochrome c family protein
MKRGLVLGLILVVAIVVPTLIAGKGDAAKGKTLYTSKCGTCHGPDGEGKAAIAKMMKVEMKSLASKDVQSKTDAQLAEITNKGTGKMAAVKGLKDNEVADIIAFVRTLAKK